MTQTLALLVDAYRELNARKMFWITLILSGLVVGIFALVGINERGFVLAFWTIENDTVNTDMVARSTFYKSLFASLGIQIWLTWAAAILALISTATIIPDLVSAGAIDLVLSKPIGRLRLFLTKYVFGLLFVTLQVAVFTAASFLVLGLRAGLWEPRIFLAIPIVVIFFSYLFSICATLGVMTKSTIAALLLTLLIWFLIFIVHAGEQTLLAVKLDSEQEVESLEERIEMAQQSIALLEERAQESPAETDADDQDAALLQDRLEAEREELDDHRKELEGTRRSGQTIGNVHRLALVIKTALPKTAETVELLNRYLISDRELEATVSAAEEQSRSTRQADQQAIQREAIAEVRSRSIWWIVGTSLLFEAFILALGAWVFCRRDY